MVKINTKKIKEKTVNIAKKIGTTIKDKALVVKKRFCTILSKEKLQKLEHSLTTILLEKPKKATKRFVYNRIDLKGINEYYEEQVKELKDVKEDNASES